jgi:hypothetical protein
MTGCLKRGYPKPIASKILVASMFPLHVSLAIILHYHHTHPVIPGWQKISTVASIEPATMLRRRRRHTSSSHLHSLTANLSILPTAHLSAGHPDSSHRSHTYREQKAGRIVSSPKTQRTQCRRRSRSLVRPAKILTLPTTSAISSLPSLRSARLAQV